MPAASPKHLLPIFQGSLVASCGLGKAGCGQCFGPSGHSSVVGLPCRPAEHRAGHSGLSLDLKVHCRQPGGKENCHRTGILGRVSTTVISAEPQEQDSCHDPNDRATSVHQQPRGAAGKRLQPARQLRRLCPAKLYCGLLRVLGAQSLPTGSRRK